MNRTCRICGTDFYVGFSGGKAVTCSAPCAKENRKQNVKNWRSKFFAERTKRNSEPKTCIECGNCFSTARPYQKFCTIRCQEINTERRRRPLPKLSSCIICRGPFFTFNPNTKTCSISCRKTHYRNLQSKFHDKHFRQYVPPGFNRKEYHRNYYRKRAQSEEYRARLRDYQRGRVRDRSEYTLCDRHLRSLICPEHPDAVPFDLVEIKRAQILLRRAIREHNNPKT